MYCRYHSFKILKYNIIQEFILIQGGSQCQIDWWEEKLGMEEGNKLLRNMIATDNTEGA